MIVRNLFLLLLLTSCGLGLDLPKHDSRFDPIVKQFSKDLKHFGVEGDPSNIIISFGNPKDGIDIAGFIPISKGTDADGLCITLAKTSNDLVKPFARIATGNHYRKKIIIIDDIHEDKDLSFLEPLVYHELGHCALNLPHNNDQEIMSEYGVQSMTQNRYFLVRELLTNEPYRMPPLRVQQNTEPKDLIYHVNYKAFGQMIDHKLFYSERSQEYYVNQSFVLKLE